MAKQPKKNDWKQLLSGGSIVVAVAGTLLLAWALQADPADPAGQMVIENSPPDHQFPEPIPIEQVEPEVTAAEPEVDPPAPVIAPAAVEPAPPADTLDARAAADLRRMRQAGDRWTLKFATLFTEESVRRKLALLNGHDQFYLVPATINGRPCHRLCWGLYPSREVALAARGLPAALTEITDQPQPTPAAKVAQ
jgi:septal ring-binding cell division protein DamX